MPPTRLVGPGSPDSETTAATGLDPGPGDQDRRVAHGRPDQPDPGHAAAGQLGHGGQRPSYRSGRSPAELLQRLRVAPAAPVGSPQTYSPSWSAPRSSCCAPCLPPSPTWTGRRAAGDVEQASAECGATPVTRASDKTKAVAFRWAVNAKARQALTTFASNSRHRSPWAAKLYAHARRRGKHHPHAVPILARAWLRVIWAGWHTNTVYDPPSTAPRNASPPEPDSGELKRTSPG
jgi:hypothetical protein